MASIRSLFWLAIVCFLVPAADGRAAATSCKFSLGQSKPIFAGVQLRRMTFNCPSDGPRSTAHVAQIDLHTQGLSLFALSAGSPQAPQTFLVSGLLRQPRNQIAVNANLFTACCAYSGGGIPTALYGLAYSDGVMWSPVGNIPPQPPPPGDFLSSLVVVDGRASIVTLAKGQAPPPGLTLAVTGTHRILTNGANTAPTDTNPADWFGPTARTVVGYGVGSNHGGQLVFPRLWLVAVDGSNGSAGVTLPQAAELLLFLGATDGINLDGGGSTTMVRQTASGPRAIIVPPTIINVPKDWPPNGGACQVTVKPGKSCERYVGFGLGVTAPSSR